MVDLFESQLVGGTVALKSRIVMAPMTRTRTSEGDVPNELMATYYGQRANAGLIVTEVINVAPSSKSYPRRTRPSAARGGSAPWRQTPVLRQLGCPVSDRFGVRSLRAEKMT